MAILLAIRLALVGPTYYILSATLNLSSDPTNTNRFTAGLPPRSRTPGFPHRIASVHLSRNAISTVQTPQHTQRGHHINPLGRRRLDGRHRRRRPLSSASASSPARVPRVLARPARRPPRGLRRYAPRNPKPRVPPPPPPRFGAIPRSLLSPASPPRSSRAAARRPRGRVFFTILGFFAWWCWFCEPWPRDRRVRVYAD